MGPPPPHWVGICVALRDGMNVTNRHVEFSGSPKVKWSVARKNGRDVKLADNCRRDALTDIALLRVPRPPRGNLPAAAGFCGLPMTSRSAMPVIAPIGNPFVLGQ